MGIELENKFKIDYKMKLAGDYIAEGKLLHALQIYEGIINEEPSYIGAYMGLSETYEQLGNITPAINLLKDFLEINPESKELRFYLGQFLLRHSQWEDAIEILSFILPEEDPLVCFLIGYCNFMLSDYEVAEINFTTFISAPGQSELFYEANLYLAKIEIKLFDFDKALKYAKKAEVLYNNYWELSSIYADIYYNLGMHAHAVVPIEKAIKLNPNETKLYDLAGKIYFKLGDFYKAEKSFLKLIESSEDITADAYTSLAETFMKENKVKDALQYFELALKIDPKNKNASEGKKIVSRVINKKSLNDV